MRVFWGFGIGLADFSRAHLMGHWAHGLDVRDALEAERPADATDVITCEPRTASVRARCLR